MISQTIQKGSLLISEPAVLMDSSFNRSIIYLTEHNSEGTVGFILNKPTQFLLKDLVFEIDSSFRVYNGGPVENDNLYFIHTIPHLIPDSIEVNNNVFWGGNYDAVISYLNQGLIKKDEIRFFLGYSGWTEKQLEREIQEKTWTLVNGDSKNIFKIDDASVWKDTLMERGGKYKIWANSPQNPNMN